MKSLARLLSGISALGSLLTLIPHHWPISLFVAFFSAFAGAFTPILAAIGALGGVLGLLTRDPLALLLGAAGAGLSGLHVARTTAPHTGFEQAFGPDWRERIPIWQTQRMLAVRWAPDQRIEPPIAEVRRDVVVGTHVETNQPLLADIWQPNADTPRSGLTVLYLHGSAWHFLDKGVGTDRFIAHLAGQGHTVVDLAYTLAPIATVGEMLNDVKRAIAWIKANAADLGVDPTKIVPLGGSAGAHLGLLAAYTANQAKFQPADVFDADTSVCGVVSYYGFTDLVTTQAYFERHFSGLDFGKSGFSTQYVNYVGQMLGTDRMLPPGVTQTANGVADLLPSAIGAPLHQAHAQYHNYSPINHLGLHCPPTLLLQGDNDSGGMMPDVLRMHRALQSLGVPTVWVEFYNTQHGFDLFFPQISPAAQAALYDAERFLALLAQK